MPATSAKITRPTHRRRRLLYPACCHSARRHSACWWAGADPGCAGASVRPQVAPMSGTAAASCCPGLLLNKTRCILLLAVAAAPSSSVNPPRLLGGDVPSRDGAPVLNMRWPALAVPLVWPTPGRTCCSSPARSNGAAEASPGCHATTGSPPRSFSVSGRRGDNVRLSCSNPYSTHLLARTLSYHPSSSLVCLDGRPNPGNEAVAQLCSGGPCRSPPPGHRRPGRPGADENPGRFRCRWPISSPDLKPQHLLPAPVHLTQVALAGPAARLLLLFASTC